MITQSRQVAKRHRDHLDTLSSGFQGRSPWLSLACPAARPPGIDLRATKGEKAQPAVFFNRPVFDKRESYPERFGSSNSAQNAQWSDAPGARRVSRSTSADRQRAASGAVARM